MLPAKELHRGDMRKRIEIAEHLRLARQVSGLSQREVAVRMGKTKSIVQLLENSPDWTVKSFLRWTHALGLQVTYKLENAPPLDTSDPLVATALERDPPHPLGKEALSLFLVERHINQIRAARGMESHSVHKEDTVGDLQRAARRINAVLLVGISRSN